MYDTLTTTYTFSCPPHGETHVRLSRFRRLEQLPGAAASGRLPRRVRVRLRRRASRARHARRPRLGAARPSRTTTPFLNLMTSRVEARRAASSASSRRRRIKAGEWPWSFFCWPEERPRPVFPSAFKLLAPAARGDRVGLAVRCPACGKVSVNLVSRAHVDVPFVNDREVGVVEHLFARRRVGDASTSSTPSSGRAPSTPAASALE